MNRHVFFLILFSLSLFSCKTTPPLSKPSAVNINDVPNIITLHESQPRKNRFKTFPELETFMKSAYGSQVVIGKLKKEQRIKDFKIQYFAYDWRSYTGEFSDKGCGIYSGGSGIPDPWCSPVEVYDDSWGAIEACENSFSNTGFPVFDVSCSVGAGEGCSNATFTASLHQCCTDATGDYSCITCDPDQVKINGSCVEECKANQERIDGQCVDKCSPDQTRVPIDNFPYFKCVKCADGEDLVNGVCVDKCEADEYRDDNGSCVKSDDLADDCESLVLLPSDLEPMLQQLNMVQVPDMSEALKNMRQAERQQNDTLQTLMQEGYPAQILIGGQPPSGGFGTVSYRIQNENSELTRETAPQPDPNLPPKTQKNIHRLLDKFFDAKASRASKANELIAYAETIKNSNVSLQNEVNSKLYSETMTSDANNDTGLDTLQEFKQQADTHLLMFEEKISYKNTVSLAEATEAVANETALLEKLMHLYALNALKPDESAENDYLDERLENISDPNKLIRFLTNRIEGQKTRITNKKIKVDAEFNKVFDKLRETEYKTLNFMATMVWVNLLTSDIINPENGQIHEDFFNLDPNDFSIQQYQGSQLPTDGGQSCAGYVSRGKCYTPPPYQPGSDVLNKQIADVIKKSGLLDTPEFLTQLNLYIASLAPQNVDPNDPMAQLLMKQIHNKKVTDTDYVKTFNETFKDEGSLFRALQTATVPQNNLELGLTVLSGGTFKLASVPLKALNKASNLMDIAIKSGKLKPQHIQKLQNKKKAIDAEINARRQQILKTCSRCQPGDIFERAIQKRLQNEIIDKNYWVVKENGKFVKYYRNPYHFKPRKKPMTEVDFETNDFIGEVKINLGEGNVVNKTPDKLSYAQSQGKKLLYVYGKNTKSRRPDLTRLELLRDKNINAVEVSSLAAAKTSSAPVVFINEIYIK